MFKLRYLWFGFAVILLVASGVSYVLNIQMYETVGCYLPYTGFLRFSNLVYNADALAETFANWEFSASPMLHYVYLYCTEQVEWEFWKVGMFPALIGVTYVVWGLNLIWGAKELIAHLIGVDSYDTVDSEEEEDDIFQPLRRYR